MEKIIKILKNNWLLVLVVAVGLFFRIYKPLEYFMFGHDQDLLGWIIKDITVNGHLRLIGQETSSKGVFIGPLFYYLQIPFFLLSKMDPKSALILPGILSLLGMMSIYYCFSKIFDKKIAFVALIIYSISNYFIWVDREPVPTMPVMLWSIWYFYGLWQILKGNSKAYILLSFLVGIIWNLNFALAILTPLIIVAQVLSRKRIELRYFFLGVFVFLISFSPFILFEARHSFMQSKAIIASLTTNKDQIPGVGRGYAKLDRVFQLVHKNASSIYWGPNSLVPYSWTFYVLLVIFAYIVKRKTVELNLALIMLFWLGLYIVFFTLNSLNLSEYYLNGMNIVWIIIMSAFTNLLLKEKNWKRYLMFVLIFIFLSFNLYSFFTRPINKSGYLERSAIVDYIKSDSEKNNYPCISISYITSPGNNLGYRYLFWIKNMHVNLPSSEAPVYTIVFPHSLVDKIDKSFGALGLILPDYKKYSSSGVKKSCEGGNSNLSDPMFGYTD